MKRVFHFYGTCLLLLFIAAGCHSLVDDSFPAQARIPVLNAVLQPDSLIRVHLSFAAGLNESLPPVIENAQVEIQSADGWRETLAYAGEGYYIGTRTSKPDEQYTCRVKIDGFASVSATTTVPAPASINDIIITPTVSKDEEGLDISSVGFVIANDTTKQLFWEVCLIKEGLEFDWLLQEMAFKSRPALIYMSAGNDLALQNEALPLTVFSNVMISDNSYKVVFYISAWVLGSMTDGGFVFDDNFDYFIELRSVDESYYKYRKQLYLYETSGGTGFGSSAQSYPLYSNVENGLGIFTAYSAVRRQIEFNK